MDKKGEGFVMTERDLAILLALERYRYMRTGQIHRLIFSNNKSVQSSRRRLRILLAHGYIERIDPFVQVGKGSAESAYFLTSKGAQFLMETIPNFKPAVYKKAKEVKLLFLQHTLDISDFRVCLELALRDHSIVELHRYVSDFEVKSHTHKILNNNRYKVYSDVEHPYTKQNYAVYPDSLIILKGKGKYEDYRKLYLLEVDRGTESLKVLQKKLIGYNLYSKQGLFKKFGKFTEFRVLFQAHSKKRAEHIREAFMGMEGQELFWVTEKNKVTAESVLSEKIWKDCLGLDYSVLR